MQVLQAAEAAATNEDVFTPVHRARFRSKAVHGDFVDSVAWFGDALLTKSVRDEVLLWTLDPPLDDTLLDGGGGGVGDGGGFRVLRRCACRGAGGRVAQRARAATLRRH